MNNIRVSSFESAASEVSRDSHLIVGTFSDGKPANNRLLSGFFFESSGNIFAKMTSHEDAVRTANWLPFAAKGLNEPLDCDVGGYFVVTDDKTSGMRSTFRGRALRGLEVETGDFKWYVHTS